MKKILLIFLTFIPFQSFSYTSMDFVIDSLEVVERKKTDNLNVILICNPEGWKAFLNIHHPIIDTYPGRSIAVLSDNVDNFITSIGVYNNNFIVDLMFNPSSEMLNSPPLDNYKYSILSIVKVNHKCNYPAVFTREVDLKKDYDRAIFN